MPLNKPVESKKNSEINTLGQMKMDIQHTKTYGTQQEQFKGKIMMMNTYIKAQDSNNLTLYLKVLEKEEKAKPKE